MNNSRVIFFLIVVFCFYYISPALCEKYNKEELRKGIEGVDTPDSAQQVFEMEKDSPKALIELILLDDPTNNYGRTNGIGALAVLAQRGILSFDEFFDVVIQLLSKIKSLALPKYYDAEHKRIIYVTTMFGACPLGENKTYKGPKISLENLVSCVLFLTKYKLISGSGTADLIINKINEAKDKLQDKQVISSETAQVLHSLVKEVNFRKDDIKEDAQKVISSFVDNIINRNWEWKK
ncbi:MAG: hypothetical protein WA705_30795 [Candidatus Ozemobacteraceae bacterium]|jgi:hypothetical protein